MKKIFHVINKSHIQVDVRYREIYRTLTSSTSIREDIYKIFRFCKIFALDTSKRPAFERERLSRPNRRREIHVESITDDRQEILCLLTNRQIIELRFESSLTIFHSFSSGLHIHRCENPPGHYNVLCLAILRNKKCLS